MGKIRINGEVDIARISIDNIPVTDELKNHILELGTGDDKWRDSSVMLANMNSSLAGNGADYQFANIQKFKIYKTIGNQNPTLYKVYETADINERVIEDYVVGDLCDYRYYIYPVCGKTIGETPVQIVSQPFTSDIVQLKDGILSVMGLIKDDTADNTYHIDKNNVWLFGLNINDSGTTLNTNKSFTDTQNRYQQETGTFRSYKTKSVTALLGTFDCTTREYTDKFEKLEAWDEFCRSSSLKVLVDLRGRVMIGDIDNNPNIEYDSCCDKEATVSFSFKEMDDINHVTILGECVTSVESEGVFHEYCKKRIYC